MGTAAITARPSQARAGRARAARAARASRLCAQSASENEAREQAVRAWRKTSSTRRPSTRSTRKVSCKPPPGPPQGVWRLRVYGCDAQSASQRRPRGIRQHRRLISWFVAPGTWQDRELQRQQLEQRRPRRLKPSRFPCEQHPQQDTRRGSPRTRCRPREKYRAEKLAWLEVDAMRFCDLTHAGEYCTTRLSSSGRAWRAPRRDSARPGAPPGRSAAKRSASAPSVSRTCAALRFTSAPRHCYKLCKQGCLATAPFQRATHTVLSKHDSAGPSHVAGMRPALPARLPAAPRSRTPRSSGRR